MTAVSQEALIGFYTQCIADGYAIASFTVGLHEALLPSLLELAEESSQPYLLHANPEDGVTHLFVGMVSKGTFYGKSRFQQAEGFVQALQANLANNVDIAPYIACAGCFLDTVQYRHSLTCLLPSWHIHWQPHSAPRVTINLALASSPETLATECLDLYQRLLHQSQAPIRQSSCSSKPLTLKTDTTYFASIVQEAIAAIQRNTYKKIVLANHADIHLPSPLNPVQTLEALLKRFPTCTTFAYKPSPHHYFFGATPETLFKTEDNQLHIDALAGSIPPNTAITEDPKLNEEHRYVVDSIVESLHQLGIQPTYDHKPTLKHLPNIIHLHTAITATLSKDQSLWPILENLYPTPALGGYPKKAALTAIQQLENFPRDLYGGFLGWFNANNHSHFTVNIRCGYVQHTTLRLYAGCGITQDSDVHTECHENSLKLKTLLPCLQLKTSS